MVERCVDCGFDLAAGRVEVVPTAHYMMGGVAFRPDCSTELAGLFAAGEDTGGVHGANRLGGNGVANSTVFGGIAGDAMAAWLKGPVAWREPDQAAVEAAVKRAQVPLGKPRGPIEDIRTSLYDGMWEDVGIVRDAASLERGDALLRGLDRQLDSVGVASGDLAFNMTWHDWLNLKNLILVSRAIAAAARAREDSRGAHFRADFPQASDLNGSRYTSVRLAGDGLAVTSEPVIFARVRPGESLVRDAAE